MNKLYVGGLEWGIRDDALREAFEVHGEVTEAKVILDRETGRSRGFGFVTFSSDDDAEKALELNETELNGRTIKVNFAKERSNNRNGGGNRYGGGGGGGGGGYNRW